MPPAAGARSSPPAAPAAGRSRAAGSARRGGWGRRRTRAVCDRRGRESSRRATAARIRGCARRAPPQYSPAAEPAAADPAPRGCRPGGLGCCCRRCRPGRQGRHWAARGGRGLPPAPPPLGMPRVHPRIARLPSGVGEEISHRTELGRFRTLLSRGRRLPPRWSGPWQRLTHAGVAWGTMGGWSGKWRGNRRWWGART